MFEVGRRKPSRPRTLEKARKKACHGHGGEEFSPGKRDEASGTSKEREWAPVAENHPDWKKIKEKR